MGGGFTINAREFKRLQAEWYEKLKTQGFNDIETSDKLTRWDSFYFQMRYEPVIFDIKKSYFEMCNEFINTYNFEDLFHKEIFVFHAEGYSLREISSIMLKQGIKIEKDTVNKIIKKYIKIMKAK